MTALELAKQVKELGDLQCDAFCAPELHLIEGVGVFCAGCGGDVLLKRDEPNSEEMVEKCK